MGVQESLSSFWDETGRGLLSILPGQVLNSTQKRRPARDGLWALRHSCSVKHWIRSLVLLSLLSSLYLFLAMCDTLNRTSSSKQLRTGWQVPRSCLILKVISGPMCWKKALRSWSRKRKKGKRKKVLQLVKQQRWVNFICCVCIWLTKLTVNSLIENSHPINEKRGSFVSVVKSGFPLTEFLIFLLGNSTDDLLFLYF